MCVLNITGAASSAGGWGMPYGMGVGVDDRDGEWEKR